MALKLGLNIEVQDEPDATFDDYLDTLIANGFDSFIRVEIPNYFNSWMLAKAKVRVAQAVAKGFDVIWGVSSSAQAITAANLTDFNDAVKAAALWAENNGVYEFQIGNEEEWHVDDDTLTAAQMRTNLKSLATEVQAIFTNGNVSYTCGGIDVDDWVTLGKGDIDIIGINVYRGDTVFNTDWQTYITAAVAEWGASTYITEFNLSMSDVANWSADENVQAAGLYNMLSFITSATITKACFYKYIGDALGAMNENGTYKKLWDVLRGVYMADPVINLTSGTGNDATSMDTASITPAANNLVLVTVVNRMATGDVNEPTLSGCGLTWAKVDGIQYDTSGSTKRITVFRGLGAEPSEGAITISFGQTAHSAGWSVDQIAGVNTSGTNGSGAIVQAVAAKEEPGTSNSFTVTLAAFGNAANITFGGFGQNGDGSPSVGSGFTILSTGRNSGYDFYWLTEFKLANDTSVDIADSATEGNYGGVAIEIKMADTTPPVITRLGDATVNLTVGDSYSDAGATALDDTDGDITGDIVTVNPVDTDIADTYTVTYNVDDAAGNHATQVSRTVIVSSSTPQTRRSLRTGYHRSLD